MHGSHAPRTARIAPLIQQRLGQLIVEELKDPRVGFVTVTDVDLSPDFQQARVFVSVMGAETTVAETLKGLKAAARFLRGRLGETLALRSLPQLLFQHDPSLAHADHISALLAADAGAPLPPAASHLPAPEIHRDLGTAAALGPPPTPAKKGRAKRRTRRSPGARRR